MRFRVWLVILVLAASFSSAQFAPASDEAIWNEFAAYVEQLQPLPPGQSIPGRTRYVAALTARGVPEAEAVRRFERVNILRRRSVDRETISGGSVISTAPVLLFEKRPSPSGE